LTNATKPMSPTRRAPAQRSLLHQWRPQPSLWNTRVYPIRRLRSASSGRSRQ
jgi:hypothetical protein